MPWLPSPDNKLRGVAVWPEPETVEAAITLYKVPSDTCYNVFYNYLFIRDKRISLTKQRSGSSLSLMYVNIIYYNYYYYFIVRLIGMVIGKFWHLCWLIWFSMRPLYHLNTK